GADAVRVVVPVVAGHAAGHRAAAARQVQVHVVEGDVADGVAGLAPQGRAGLSGLGPGHVGVVDGADAAEAGTAAAALAGADLLHDRRRRVGHRHVVVVDVADVRAVHGHQAQSGLAGAGDGDVRELVVGEVA